MFDAIVGNEPVKTYLTTALRERRLPHALLFAGEQGELFAQELAAHLLTRPIENNPDFHPLRPEGNLHLIESIRTLIDEVRAPPFAGPCKVFLLFEAELLPPVAANALLKIVEEPPPDATLILLASSSREMLPTLLSRCTRFSLQPLSSGVEETLFGLLSKRPSYLELFSALETIEKEVEKEAAVADRLFASFFMWMRDQHLRKIGGNLEKLFFPHVPPVPFPLPSLEAVEKKIEEARLAFQRNIKLSVCLERLFNIQCT